MKKIKLAFSIIGFVFGIASVKLSFFTDFVDIIDDYIKGYIFPHFGTAIIILLIILMPLFYFVNKFHFKKVLIVYFSGFYFLGYFLYLFGGYFLWAQTFSLI